MYLLIEVEDMILKIRYNIAQKEIWMDGSEMHTFKRLQLVL